LRSKASLFVVASSLASIVLIAGQTSRAARASAPPVGAQRSAVTVNTLKIRQNAQEEEAREKGVFLTTLAHGDLRLKEVALTFDDGPHPLWTPQLLDLLKSLKVRATFFLVGKMVDRYPALAMREVAEGHEIANHTYNHPNLTKLTPAQIQDELRKGAESIKRAVGYAPVFFRPPGGQYNASTLAVAHAMKLTPVLWTVNSKDFMHPNAELMEQRLLAAPAAGGILLCHDGIEETMRILPDLVSRLRAQGYSFVTVSELAQHVKN
jgi:peptidoglycan/xylan/chitin deacetylase (PgdA/CDA1 family)